MRQYELTIFEDEIARHYYGQESKLFYLFLEHERASGDKKMLLTKQVEFITKPIPALLLQQKIRQALGNVSGYSYRKNTHVLDFPNSDSRAELVIGSDTVYLTADGTLEGETRFFEILRKCEPTFFAVNLADHKYGWLRPIRQDDLLKSGGM